MDLGHGFFLTRLSLREDYENILKNGPWFVGEHFLSIRPWELNFKPASRVFNVSILDVEDWVTAEKVVRIPSTVVCHRKARASWSQQKGVAMHAICMELTL